MFAQETSAMLWQKYTIEQGLSVGKNWLFLLIIFQSISFLIAMLPMWWLPLFVLSESTTKIWLTGVMYRI
jgi:hypothetical protein